jgi:hypothetical protein
MQKRYLALVLSPRRGALTNSHAAVMLGVCAIMPGLMHNQHRRCGHDCIMVGQ